LVLNLFLRALFVLNFALLTDVGRYASGFHREASMTLFSILELYRRFQWNVLRLENEHLNNCGQFRAIVEIPEDIEVEE
jgi:hypothetical protein